MRADLVGSVLRRRSRATAVLLAVGAAALLALGAGAVRAADGQYVKEDAKFSGKQIHTFSDGGEQVSVFLGDFVLTMGKYVISGRDGVVWIRDAKVGNVARRDITVYVEGDAKVVEPSGAATTDRTMLVVLHQQGDLTATGNASDQPATNLAVYKNALAERKKAAEGATKPATQEAATGPATREAAATGTAPATGAAPTTGPPAPTAPASTPDKAPKTEPTTEKAARPPRTLAFEAAGGSSEIRGNRRITVARDVHLFLGDRKSELSLELSAQSAVIFSERRPPKDTSVPWSPRFAGAMSDLPGPKDERETLVGAYLEGDVQIRRGQRSMRGPAAYYDFTTDRAIITEPVFRTIQEQRNIPVYIRADEARELSAREMYFKNARVSTSDFYSPSYHIGATTARLMDTTPYDEQGVRLGPQSWHSILYDTTFNVRSVPIMYWPRSESDVEVEQIPLRKVSVGSQGPFGLGIETEWYLFRLLGLVAPKGFDATAEFDWYRRGPMIGAKLDYERDTYSGYSQAYGMLDQEQKDVFGEEREDIAAPEGRGRVLVRHKQIMPQDWELQFELSYLSDRNFLEQLFPDEYYAGKEQETLLYAKKQQDNWALTALLQYRLNEFQSQTDSAPDLGFHLINQPLLPNNMVTLFSESHAGLKRYSADVDANEDGSAWMARLDTREELDVPLKLGPVNVVPYVTGRATYWGDTPNEGGKGRLYGQAGMKAATSFWRAYREASSRFWDVNGLKHVITPEITGFVSDTGDVEPADLFPMDPDVERHMRSLNGVVASVSQRLMTKRGPKDERHRTEWMRLDVSLGFYDEQFDPPRSDGRFFWYRPEYSLARHHLNAEYTWNISDATALLADINYDIDSQKVGRTDVGLAFARDPRTRYYVGWRRISEMQSSVLTLGLDYKISPKYSLSFFEQYDIDYEGGTNLGTSVSLMRKMERWYMAVTFTVTQRDTGNDIGLYLTLWPEGVPEFRVTSGRMPLNSTSSMN